MLFRFKSPYYISITLKGIKIFFGFYNTVVYPKSKSFIGQIKEVIEIRKKYRQGKYLEDRKLTYHFLW